VLTTRAPTRINRAASSALSWTAVLVCALYAAFALGMAIAAVLQLLGVTEAGGGRSAPPLFILHAISGAVALLAGSLQLRLATRLLRDRRRLHRRIGQIYLWAAWITSLSSLGVAGFFDVSLAAKTAFAGVSLLWFATTTVGFVRIRQGRVAEHREWMIRSFSLALFFVTGSLWPSILAATELPQAIGYPLALFLSWSLNLIAAEWWIHRTRARQHRNLRAELGTSRWRRAHPPTPGSTADALDRPLPDPSEAGLRCLLLTLGAVQLVLGSWMALAPASFHAAVAPFGVRNEHLLRDLAAVSLVLGVAALVAAARPIWRVPVLAVTLLQFILRTLNHLLDIGGADRSWLGPANALVLGLATVALALTLHALRQPAAHRVSRPSRIEGPQP
jgi:uncharacterized membrane protein YozB (DUF420 family)